MLLVFVHGWSVVDTDTYGGMAEVLATAQGDEIEIANIYLGKYVSFSDEVRMPDLVRAFDYALRNDIRDNADGRREFSCITHSTGGPVIREWVDWAYGGNLGQIPLRHLVMLAPANHGSSLAALGQGAIGRIRYGIDGVEPGQGVLDWLRLGSDESWALAMRYLGYRLQGGRFFPFVLSGETIDKKFYDFVNAYLGEAGSDGVVRLAGANLNYSCVMLRETAALLQPPANDEKHRDPVNGRLFQALAPDAPKQPPETAFGVIPKASHSGNAFGIIRSVTPATAAAKPVVAEILKCLGVADWRGYETRVGELKQLTAQTQQLEAKGRFVMFVFRVQDDLGRRIDDFDMIMLGTGYSAEGLPSGFMIDKQKNESSHELVFYMDYDKLVIPNELGFRVIARPTIGWPQQEAVAFSGYFPCEFRMTRAVFTQFVQPNETFYVDIELKRHVARETFRLDTQPPHEPNFKNAKPGAVIV